MPTTTDAVQAAITARYGPGVTLHAHVSGDGGGADIPITPADLIDIIDAALPEPAEDPGDLDVTWGRWDDEPDDSDRDRIFVSDSHGPLIALLPLDAIDLALDVTRTAVEILSARNEAARAS